MSHKTVPMNELLNDSDRAALNANFRVAKDQLISMVECYRQRKYVEELDYLKNELKGPQNLCESLDVNPETGINANSLDIRTSIFGTHHKDPPERTPFLTLVLGALDDFMLKLLLVCATVIIPVEVGFAHDETERKTAWIEGFVIYVAVAVVSLVSAGSDYSKEGQFLSNLATEDKARMYVVMRDGKEEIIHRNELKVGDILQIKSGMNIPVDGVIIQGTDVLCDESAMTGESDHLPKEAFDVCLQKQAEFEADGSEEKTHHSVPSPLLLSGTFIQKGQGWFICIVVGDMTCEGQIMAALDEKTNEVTALQQKLEVIAIDIGHLGMFVAALIIHILILRYLCEGLLKREFDLFGGEESSVEGVICDKDGIDKRCDGKIGFYIQKWIQIYIVGITIVVVAVPEGLPLAVMISLAYSISKMLLDNNFVKKMSSCEIMGGANNICSDKTGTLTKNQMTWTNIWCGGDFKVQNPDAKEKLDINYFMPTKFAQDLLFQTVCCNTEGDLDNAGATEKAMLKFIHYKCGIDFESIRKSFIPRNPVRFLFDSARKRMSTVVELPANEKTEHDYQKRIHVKGASEIVLASCNFYLDSEGKKKIIDDQMMQQLEFQIKTYAKQALRTIAFGYKDLKQGDGGNDHKSIQKGAKIYDIEESGFTLICIAGIKDIIRDEVPDAVKQCNKAGVRVRMVTGDNKITAIAIAKECGIMEEGEENEECVCMEGPEFCDFVGGLINKGTGEQVLIMGKDSKNEVIGNMENMKIVRNKLKVLARSRPNDKYIMVTGLKHLGDIVAVTGDGTNDAPALRRADVGFAMKTGTSVAHSAAAIIIQDDNFASIVKACMWGRNIYDNIRRFLQFQLTINLGALSICFIGSVVTYQSPLAAIQLLWINLIMDTLAALALATGPPSMELLNRPPYRKKEYIISRKMLKHIIGQAIFQNILLYAVIFGGENFINEAYRDFNSIGIDESLIRTHKNEKIQKWTTEYILSGMLQDYEGKPYYEPFMKITDSRHLTVVFNLFVYLQVANMFCARKINDEFNIFEGIHRNALYAIIVVIIAALQFILCQFGNIAIKVHKNGLTGIQWAWCLGFSCLTFPVNFLLKFVPDSWFYDMGQEDPKDIEKHALDYKILARKTRELSSSVRNRSFQQ